jgi:hypothetical protein
MTALPAKPVERSGAHLVDCSTEDCEARLIAVADGAPLCRACACAGGADLTRPGHKRSRRAGRNSRLPMTSPQPVSRPSSLGPTSPSGVVSSAQAGRVGENGTGARVGTRIGVAVEHVTPGLTVS